MSAKISSVPLEVDIARCQSELKRDRHETRASRALMEERRIRVADQLADEAFVMKSVDSMVGVFRKAFDIVERTNDLAPAGHDAAAEHEQAAQAECAKAAQEGFHKCLQGGAEEMQNSASSLRAAAMGEDFATNSSSKMTTQLSKLKRSPGLSR